MKTILALAAVAAFSVSSAAAACDYHKNQVTADAKKAEEVVVSTHGAMSMPSTPVVVKPKAEPAAAKKAAE